MAEGFLRALAGDRIEVQSAGTRATRVHPLAIEAMREVEVYIGKDADKDVGRMLAQATGAEFQASPEKDLGNVLAQFSKYF